MGSDGDEEARLAFGEEDFVVAFECCGDFAEVDVEAELAGDGHFADCRGKSADGGADGGGDEAVFGGLVEAFVEFDCFWCVDLGDFVADGVVHGVIFAAAEFLVGVAEEVDQVAREFGIEGDGFGDIVDHGDGGDEEGWFDGDFDGVALGVEAFEVVEHGVFAGNVWGFVGDGIVVASLEGSL